MRSDFVLNVFITAISMKKFSIAIQVYLVQPSLILEKTDQILPGLLSEIKNCAMYMDLKLDILRLFLPTLLLR